MYNTLLRSAVLSDGDVLERDDLARVIEPDGKGVEDLLECPLAMAFRWKNCLTTSTAIILRRAMQEAQGVKSRAAELLGMKHYQTLDQQLKRLKVEYRPNPSP